MGWFLKQKWRKELVSIVQQLEPRYGTGSMLPASYSYAVQNFEAVFRPPNRAKKARLVREAAELMMEQGVRDVDSSVFERADELYKMYCLPYEPSDDELVAEIERAGGNPAKFYLFYIGDRGLREIRGFEDVRSLLDFMRQGRKSHEGMSSLILELDHNGEYGRVNMAGLIKKSEKLH